MSQQVNVSSAALPPNEVLLAGPTHPEVMRFNNAQVAGYEISGENSALCLRGGLKGYSGMKEKGAICSSIKSSERLVPAAQAQRAAWDRGPEGRSRALL